MTNESDFKELPNHASTGLNSFVTRLQFALRNARGGMCYVSAMDLNDMIHNFIRLDNESRAHQKSVTKVNWGG